MTRFCYDERHDVLCEQPCKACQEECDPTLALTAEEAIERGLDE